MINIKAKKEKNGIITHLKSEYGNIFSRETVIQTIRKGFIYCTLSHKNSHEQIYVLENDKGIFLSVDNQIWVDREKISKDNIRNIPNF
jgi:predicted molibdopterin-dependent oxidoreductase YjgC